MRDLRNYIEAIRDLPLEEKAADKIFAGTSPESLKLSLQHDRPQAITILILLRRWFCQVGIYVSRFITALRFNLQPAFFFFHDVKRCSSGYVSDNGVLQTRSAPHLCVSDRLVLPIDLRIECFLGFTSRCRSHRSHFDIAWRIAFF